MRRNYSKNCLLLFALLLISQSHQANYMSITGDSSSPVIGTISCAILDNPNYFMAISSTTVASYRFLLISSSLVYSTPIPGGQGKSVTGLSRTTWFAVTTGDSKIIFFDKLTSAIVKTWVISSPSDFLKIDSFIESDFMVTSDANKVLAYWDRS